MTRPPTAGAALTVAIASASLALFPSACRRQTEPAAIRASGHIEATEVRLAATVGGKLLALPFTEGDVVRAGEVVARFDTTELERELARARAEQAAAEAQLRLLLAGSREEDLRQAAEQLAAAVAEVEAAERDLARLATLAARGAATAKARDDAATRLDVARRRAAAAQAQHDKLRAGPRREEIDAARARVTALAASVAAIEHRISEATVLAPCDGVITARAAEPGEVLPPGATLAVLTDLSHPYLTVFLDEPSLARVAIGQRATVTVDGHDGSFPATVSFVSPVAEFTPKNVQTPEERATLVFRVKLSLDNPRGIFKPGMPADAILPPAGKPGSPIGGRP